MKASYIALGLLFFAGLATSCDNISEEDRYIKQEKPTVDNPRTLLIMEFTGNKCANCPNGANTINQIKEDEGEGKVISVGLHPYGDINTNPVLSDYPKPHMQDFRTDAATAMYDYYKPNGFPSAIFNGLKSSMSGSIPDWMQRASEALIVPAKMAIRASCSYDESSRELNVDYTIEFGNNIESKLSVMVWVVENDILGTQTMPDGSVNKNYVHNHVLRASLNGNWGEEIGNSFYVDSSFAGHASMILKEDWVAENCDVVVYVFRDEDKEVEQATSISIRE